MFSTVNPENASRFLYLRRRAEVLNIAIKMSDHAGLEPDEYYDITVEHRHILSELAGMEFKILSDFITSNVLPLKEGTNLWGFVYESKYKEGRRKIWVLPVREGITKEELEQIASKKSFNPEKDLLLVKDYEYFQKEYISIEREALNIVEKQTSPMVFTKDGKQQTLLVTYHALRRWIERVANIPTFPIPKEMRAGVFQDIQKDFQKAKFVYHSDLRESDFYFNEESLIFYCVKSSNMLISLWKNSFQPFEYEKLKRQIILLQLEYITNMQQEISIQRNSLMSMISEKERALRLAEADIVRLENQISAIQDKIAEKRKSIEQIQSESQSVMDKIQKMEDKLQEQENILFTKTDVDILEEDLAIIGSFQTMEDAG